MSTTKAERPHVVLDINEAIKSSPRFLRDLDEHYAHFMKTGKRGEDCSRQLEVINEQGQNFVASLYNLTASLNCLWADMEIDEPAAKGTYRAISEALGQIVNLNRSLIETTFPALKSDLEMFNKNELAKLRVSKSQFDAISVRHQEALHKRASISRSSSQALTQAKNELTAVGTCFAHQSLDYVAQINIAHARKHHVFLDALYHFYKDYSTFFKKGHLYFCEQPDNTLVNALENINSLKSKSKLVERKMQDRHNLVSKEVFENLPVFSTDPFITVEGYLFKRSSKAFKTWHRRWFMVKGEKLMYIKKSGENLQSMVMEEDLKLCLVRPASMNIERTSCFELVTQNRIHVLQADSDKLCYEWIHAIQSTIQHLHEGEDGQKTGRQFLKNIEATTSSMSGQTNGLQNNYTLLPNHSPEAVSSARSNAGTTRPTIGIIENSMSFYDEVKKVPGNRTCADCDNIDSKWTSISLGVVICIECSGAHRSLGVHVSKVRSLTMDDLSDEQKGVLLALGNYKVNAIYLAGLHEVKSTDFPTRIYPNSERGIREQYITAKYVDKRFAKPLVNKLLNNMLGTHRSSSFQEKLASSDSNLPSISKHAQSSGTNMSSRNSHSNLQASANTSLHASIQNALAVSNSETCLHNVGEIPIEQQARTALQEGDLGIIMRLMASGFDINSRIDTRYPLHIAVENNHPVLVEFLFLNGAQADVRDQDLNTALHIAAEKGFITEACQLVKRVVDKNLKNVRGERPLDLAIRLGHANIVTLFRLDDLPDEGNNDGTKNAVDHFIKDLNRSKNLAPLSDAN